MPSSAAQAFAGSPSSTRSTKQRLGSGASVITACNSFGSSEPAASSTPSISPRAAASTTLAKSASSVSSSGFHASIPTIAACSAASGLPASNRAVRNKRLSTSAPIVIDLLLNLRGGECRYTPTLRHFGFAEEQQGARSPVITDAHVIAVPHLS